MKKEDFDRKNRDVKILLADYYKGEKEVAYILLSQAPGEEGNSHSSILSNVKPPIIVPFVLKIITRIGSLIGRQN